MVRKSLSLDGMLNTQTRPIDTGIPQRGAGLQPPSKPAAKAPKKREGEKRLTLALDGEAYRACGCMPPKLIRHTKTLWKLPLRNTLIAQMRSYVNTYLRK